mgnify:CR=1 FL=1
MNKEKNILSKIQTELKAPKGQTNKFGGYKYRSAEDILEAIKPLLKKYERDLTISDDMVDYSLLTILKTLTLPTTTASQQK